MYARVQHFADRLARNLMTDDLDHILSDHDFPLPLHLEDRFILIEQPCDFSALMGEIQHLRAEAGISISLPEVVAVELPRAGRFRAWVRWHHRSAEACGRGHSDYVYYLHERGSDLAIEMLHITHLSITGLRDWRTEMRRSA